MYPHRPQYAYKPFSLKSPKPIPMKTVRSSTNEQPTRGAYIRVSRLGVQLRDRCTESDPERTALDDMLEQLRASWSEYQNNQAVW